MTVEYQKLTASNGTELAKYLPSFKQPLPFFLVHTVAQKVFLQALAKYDEESDAQFSLLNNGQLIALISYQEQDEGIYITNFLLSPVGFQLKKGLGFWLGKLEKQVKLLGVQQLVLSLCLLDITLPDRLVSFGYQVNFETNTRILAKKALIYRTGLVLAGGGARGAYQIGVWRALRELGISYEIVTGTSVGALNGALMVQNDYQVAETMWEEIDTGKILSYPHVGEADQQDSRQVLKEVQRFAHSALLHQGVSTKPLAQMIHRLLNGEKMRASTKELYICTTEFPSLKEIIISVDEVEPDEFSQWLLASSSFFPAMAATKIGDNHYIDGGYRNNIPIDVALKAGATELIMVNVKGPGITKPTKLPSNLPLRIVASPWGLGTVLFFDGSRSQWNIKLGYAEALKSFGHYRGYWYTYSGDFNQRDFQQRVAQDLERFKASLMEAELAELFKGELIANLTRKISRLYQERLTEEGLYLYLLELAAKELKVDPTVCYNFVDFLTAIKVQLNQRQRASREECHDEQSLSTWVKERGVDFALPLETQHIHNLVTLIKRFAIPQSQLLVLAKLNPLNYLVAKLLIHLE